MKHHGDYFYETYDGPSKMETTEQQKYLGLILSSKGDNMKNIMEMKRKSVWVINKIFDKLKSINLKKYFFECAIIFLNVILRNSILYASETYYNLKEKEIRILERIEECFLRKLLKTTKACPISQLYLETGHQPARFDIMKRRLLFLKSILNEKQENLIYQFVSLQYKDPRRGDWVSSCLQNLKYLNINLSFEEIKDIKRSQFQNILRKSIKEKAYEYLIEKRGRKGIEIDYRKLKMQEYLLPDEELLSISDKQMIFAIRNRMVNIEHNFPRKDKTEKECICGDVKNMKHLYSCKRLNIETMKTPYENIFGEDVRKMKIVYERFKNNLEKCISMEESPMGSSFVDPLYGNKLTNYQKGLVSGFVGCILLPTLDSKI